MFSKALLGMVVKLPCKRILYIGVRLRKRSMTSLMFRTFLQSIIVRFAPLHVQDGFFQHEFDVVAKFGIKQQRMMIINDRLNLSI